MRSAPWLFLLVLPACGGPADPVGTTTAPPLEDIAPYSPPLPAHDLAGAPPLTLGTPVCTPAGTGPSGAELAEAVEAIRAGVPGATVDHRALLARCEIEPGELVEAYVGGAAVARTRHHDRLATTLLVEALHTDPDHLQARIDLAAVLAATDRPLAALTHLRELRRAGDDGLAALAAVTGDERFDELHRETDGWLALMHPEAVDPEPVVLAPRGEPIALPPGIGTPPTEARYFPIDVDWTLPARLLAATPGVPPLPDGWMRTAGDDPWLEAEVPPVLLLGKMEGYLAVRWLRPADGVLYLMVAFIDRDPTHAEQSRTHYALYRVEGSEARLVRARQLGDTPCEGSEPGAARETWFGLPDGEVRELSLCNDRISMARLRHEDGELRLHESSFAAEPAPASLEAGAWVPRESASPAAGQTDGVPDFGPPATCRPGEGGLAGDALGAALAQLSAGRDVGATVEALTASCTVDASDVAEAFLGAARARSSDPGLARELLVRALLADARHAGARYELAVMLAGAGSEEAALRQIRMLAGAGEAAWPFLRASAHDRRLARLRGEAYWSLTLANRRAFVDAGVRFDLQEPPGQPIASRLRPPVFEGDARIQPDRRAWSGALALLRASMTPRAYRRRPAGTLAPDVLPQYYRGDGFVRADQPTWWRPMPETTLLVVPYVHPEEGFHAIGIYAPGEGGLRYVGRDRAFLRGCGDGPGVTSEIGFDGSGSDLWLLVSCQWYVQLCRFTMEGGELREVCTAQRNERTATGEEP